MEKWLRIVLFSWEWRPEILISLAIAGLLYINGWRRMRGLGRHRLASRPRLFAYISGLIALTVATLSFIDLLGGQLFYMHMVQHLLLTMAVPVLIWSANPFPLVIWGLPPRLRGAVAVCLRRGSSCRRVLSAATRPAVAWLLYMTIFLGWHNPYLYNLSLRRSGVHDLQHITFTVAALLFWWHLFAAGPRLHRKPHVVLRTGYLLAAIPPTMLTGISIALADQPFYTYYESIPRIWGVTVMQDQMIGGAIMWIPTNMMYILAALLVLALGLREEEKRRQSPMNGTEGSVEPKTADFNPPSILEQEKTV